MKDKETRAQVEQIQNLLQYFEQQANSETRERATELLRSVMDLHSACLGRIVSTIADRGAVGQEILAALAGDESVSGLLVLYGLHPVPLNVRVERALTELASALKNHNAEIELVAIDQGVVRLRLTANGSGCHSSAATLKETINETLIGAAPDLIDLIIDEVPPEPKLVFVPLETLTRRPPVAKTSELA